MRDLIRSFVDFSWALSVFGASQSTKVLQTPDQVAKSFWATTETLKEQFNALDRTIYNIGESAQNAVLGAPPSMPHPASSPQVSAPVAPHQMPSHRPIPPQGGTPRPGRLPVDFPLDARAAGSEELIILYTVGKGYFSAGPPFYINLLTDNYDFQGNWIGYQAGVNFSADPPQASLTVPDPPQLPITSPPVPSIPATSWTKGVFTFNDGAVIVEGPALTHLTPVKGGGFLFSVTTSHVITAGTQLYEGARGIKAATGTAFVPQELIDSGRFPSAGLEFPVTTLESFRLIRKQFLDEAVNR